VKSNTRLDEHICVRVPSGLKRALQERAEELRLPERSVVRMIVADALRGDTTPDWFKELMQRIQEHEMEQWR
jgi:hypothetical protein